MAGKIYFTADPHFFHENIIKYCNRPFENVKEMNDYIVKQWNSVIQKDDVVWLLGDLALNCTKDEAKSVIEKLHGNIKIVLGNHDHWPMSFYQSLSNVSYVSKYPVIIQDFFILSHTPMFVSNNAPYFNIFGHVHNNPEFTTETEHSLCVSMERWDYKPIQCEALKEYLDKKSKE